MDPVALNETLLVSGSGLGTGGAEVCDRLGVCSQAPSLVPSNASSKFVVPPTLAGASTYSFALASGPKFVINLPQLDWWRCEGAAPQTDSAFPGGLLRIFGRSLAWSEDGSTCPPLTHGGLRTPGAAKVVLVAAGSPPSSGIVLAPDVSSCWRIDVTLPATLPDAKYDVWVSNSLSGPGLTKIGAAGGASGLLLFSFSVGAGPDPPPSAVFTLGVTPDCKTVAACVATAGKAGGGTVLLPPGVTYATNSDAIVFPANAYVVLAGAGMNASELTWLPGTGFPNGISAVVTGEDASARWALRDVTLSVYSGYHTGAQPALGMPVVFVPTGSVGVRLDRVRIIEDLSKEPQMEAGNSLRAFGAAALSITDCEIYFGGNCGAQWPGNTPLSLNNVTDVSILRTTFTSACQSWAISGSRIFLADSSFKSVGDVSGGAQVGTDGGAPFIAENIYIGNNSDVGNPAALMRWETMTYDGSSGWFNGTSSGVDASGTTMTLSSPMLGCPAGSERGCVFPGATIAIMRGLGQGQWRRVLSISNATSSPKVLLDAAFDVQPSFGPDSDPASSFISITVTHGQATFEGNFYLNGTTFQTYGAAMQTVVAGNTFREMFTTEYMNSTAVAAGLRLFGHRYVNGYQPNWWTLLTDNVIDCTTEFRIYADNIDNIVFQYAAVVRRNVVTGVSLDLNFAHDDVIEHNAFDAGFCAYAGTTLPAGDVVTNSSSSGIVVR
jgi:hypothetical protein